MNQDAPAAPQTFRRGLALLLLFGLLQQIWLLADYWAHDPFARVPLDDAKVYWNWAERIGHGELVGDAPFLSAPLYPYFLGLVRAAGGGLLAVYALQGLLRLATAVLLAQLGRRWFSPAAGLAAAGLFLLLLDPAAATGRILNESLQVFLAAALLWECGRAPGPAPPWRLGLLLGLNALANPPMLAAVPLLAWWIGRDRQWRRGLAAAGLAALVIAPATLHNWAASGEFILVSAQSGVTFSHGNAPGASGVYQPIAGVSADRVEQNRDAFRMAAAATGAASWRSTSSFFLRRGLAFWAERPGAALHLLLQKARWFATGQHYGDVYLATSERRSGYWRALYAAPLSLAWLTLPALAMALALARRWREFLPLQLLYLLPLAVVLAFFYSPRYRLPAAAPAVLLAVGSAQALLRERRLWHAAPWVIGAAAVALNAATGFDRPASLAAQYEQKTGAACLELGQPERAASHFRSALASQPGDPGFTASLGEALRRQGKAAEAIPELRRALQAHPQDLHLRRTLAVTLAEEFVTRKDPALAADAEREFRTVLQTVSEDWVSRDNLGVLLDQQGRAYEAAFEFLAAAKSAPEQAAVGQHLEAVLQVLLPYYRQHAGDPLQAAAGAWLVAHLPHVELPTLDLALAWAQSAVDARPGDADFLDTLAAIHGRRGEFAAAAEAAERALDAARADGNDSLAAEIDQRLAGYQARRHVLMED